MVKAASLAICLAASAAMLVDAKCKKPAITGKNNDYAVNIYAATDCMSDPKSPKQTYKHAGKLSGKCMTIPHPLRGNIESFEFDTYMYWATLVFYNATGCHSHNALVCECAFCQRL
ncbi:hypothetical protein BJ138DRAFT_1153182 [Hygrophoropsis aurantiaca]|uniref:Uncharacterized protein n=1 Tax=Hygrophoropsis aurantiaca TaxID=72124 RepID=A0ACB8AC26_9AGAM|nr:hypothetical protein BJ138DRAFT_1153182 [Hygrophoropsis aurantiaca]